MGCSQNNSMDNFFPDPNMPHWGFPLIGIDMSRPGEREREREREKMTWPGSGGLSMIGECRWVLQCFPYRHWISSPPLKAAAAASPGTSCTEPQFSGQASICRRERGDKMR